MAVLLSALAGIAAVIGLARGWLSIGALAGAGAAHTEPGTPSMPSAPGHDPLVAARARAKGPSETSQPPAPTGPKARAFRVCAREEAPARLDALSSGTHSLYAIHCGSEAHLVSIEAERAELIVRRVARIALPGRSPAHTAAPARITSVDLSGDGARGLVVPTLRVDVSGAPVSGAIFVLPLLADGSLGAPSHLTSAVPGDLVVGQLERTQGEDLGVLQLADARLAQSAELWVLGGGSSPERKSRVSAGVGANTLALARLDGDALDDVAVLQEAAERVRVLFSTRGFQGDATEVEAKGAHELRSLDWDGNGEAELYLAGERLQRLEVSAGPNDALEVTLRDIDVQHSARNLHLLDVDADGKLDLVGYAHPEIVAWLGGTEPLRRRTLVRLHGAGYSVLQAQLAHLDGDGAWDLLVLAAADVGEPAVVLLTAHALPTEPDAPVELSLDVEPSKLRDAPLARTLELR